MNVQKRVECKETPSLRIFWGEEVGDSGKPEDEGRERPPYHLDSEAELFWAGRNPAARISARIAA